MRVGWARVDCAPGAQLGSDENSWAFDGFNVSLPDFTFCYSVHACYHFIFEVSRPQFGEGYVRRVFV
jgi:hypothetical protein